MGMERMTDVGCGGRVEEEKRKRASFLWVEKAVEETDGREEGMEIKAYFPFEH